MAEFRSYRSFWDFYSSVSHERRFVLTTEQIEFLATVLETSKKRLDSVLQGYHLWRAQIGHVTDVEENDGEEFPVYYPYPPERMKPENFKASEGRANPKGIPYLYSATKINTAVAEVRPWVGARVSVALLKTTRPLTIVNCTSGKRPLLAYADEPDAPQREQEVWHDIDYAFSRPIANDEREAEYVPTQILAEYFKAGGLDGIRFKSSLGAGDNITLFDLNAAEIVDRYLVTVTAVHFTISEPEDRQW